MCISFSAHFCTVWGTHVGYSYDQCDSALRGTSWVHPSTKQLTSSPECCSMWQFNELWHLKPCVLQDLDGHWNGLSIITMRYHVSIQLRWICKPSCTLCTWVFFYHASCIHMWFWTQTENAKPYCICCRSIPIGCHACPACVCCIRSSLWSPSHRACTRASSSCIHRVAYTPSCQTWHWKQREIWNCHWDNIHGCNWLFHQPKTKRKCWSDCHGCYWISLVQVISGNNHNSHCYICQ